MAMTKQELKQERIIAKMKLSPSQLKMLRQVTELERELTLMEEQPH